MLMADRTLGWILLLLALVSLVEGFRIWDEMGGSGFMPVIVGSIFVLLGLGFLTRKSQPEKDLPLPWPSKMGLQRLGLVFTALAGGHIDFAAQQYSESSGLILGKKIKGLAVVNPEKLPAVPDVPTAKEVVEKWTKTLEMACKDPTFLEQAARIYKIVSYLGPGEFWDFMQAEYKRYLPLATRMGIRKK